MASKQDTSRAEMPVAELVQRCLCGDDQAKALLFAEYAELAKRAVIRKLASLGLLNTRRSEVGDICHDMFERILANNCQMLARLHKPASINAWVVTVAQNLTVDHVRKWSRRAKIDAAVAADAPSVVRETPARYAIRSEAKNELARKLDSFPPVDRLILEMFFVQGLKYCEIAEVTGLNINSVAAKLRRSKQKLRTLMEKD
jgi:RNA polymerase sigma-70 factor (ECF subfamily)